MEMKLFSDLKTLFDFMKKTPNSSWSSHDDPGTLVLGWKNNQDHLVGIKLFCAKSSFASNPKWRELLNTPDGRSKFATLCNDPDSQLP